jgi:hypothetical protein
MKNYLENETMISKILPEFEHLLRENLDEIKTDMNRLYEDGEADKAFKFPVTVKIELKPAGPASESKIDIGWGMTKKRSTGYFKLEEDGQTKLEFDKKTDNSDKTIGELPSGETIDDDDFPVTDEETDEVLENEPAPEIDVEEEPLPDFPDEPEPTPETSVMEEVEPVQEQMFESSEAQERYDKFMGNEPAPEPREDPEEISGPDNAIPISEENAPY